MKRCSVSFISTVGTQLYSCQEMFIKLWAGPTIEASTREAVVYRFTKKVLFTGTEHCCTMRTLDRKSLSSSGQGRTVEVSMRETVVYQSVEKVLFVGATHSMSMLSTASMDGVIPVRSIKVFSRYVSSKLTRILQTFALCSHGRYTNGYLTWCATQRPTRPWLLTLLE